MKKVKYLSLGIIVVIAIGISGCNKITPKPQVYHDKTRATGIKTIGIDKNIEVNGTTYEVIVAKPEVLNWDELQKYRKENISILHKWGPNEFNTIYRDRDDCLTDINNTGFFTHEAEEDKMESLDKLKVPIGYEILAKSTYSKIQEPQVYHDSSKVTGKTVIRIPALNAIKTVEIGENIYQKINQYAYNTYEIILIKPENISDSNWRKINEEVKGEFLSKWTAANYNALCTKGKQHCLVDADKTNVFTYDVIPLGDNGTIYMLTQALEYKIMPTPPTYDVDSFKYQALYQGRIGNKIKISFREFKDDMARPAFTQDIEYELDKNGEAIVGFKGLRIKILKASNMDITYSVIQDYN